MARGHEAYPGHVSLLTASETTSPPEQKQHGRASAGADIRLWRTACGATCVSN